MLAKSLVSIFSSHSFTHVTALLQAGRADFAAIAGL